VIETGWLVPRRLESDKGFWKSVGRFFRFSKKDQKDRFRVQVTANAGQSAESSIVRINHTQAGNPLPAQVKWPKTPANPELVAVVYDELMEFFEDGGRKIGASVLTQDLKALPKYTMTWDGNGFPILVISKDFNYAWLAVGQALARARIGVTDLDRTLGIYYLDEKTKISGKKDEIREVQLRLVNSESGIQVAVQVDDDTVAPKELSANILNRIRENLE
jgi:outer membrane protein assembly factor BamC